MKAAVLKRFGVPLDIEQVEAPVLGTGEVIVDIVAAGGVIIANRKVRNFAPGAEGLNGSFADLWIDPSV